MKKKFLNPSLFVSVGLLAFGVVGLSSCGNKTFTSATVVLDKNSITIDVGESYQLSASVSKGYSAEMRWFSSDEHVVVVDNGYCFGVGKGEAIVTASYGGGYADCFVKVVENGGGEETEKLVLSVTKKTIEEGKTFNITHSVYPADTVVTYTSDDTSIATVESTSSGATVSAVKEGKTTIRASGSNGKFATCSVEVTKAGGGGERDIAVDKNLGYTGSLIIGSPILQHDFMVDLLNDFNTLTNSSIKFTVTNFEEDNGTSGYASAESMPAVFPYASDQTLTLYQFKALSNVSKTDTSWIKEQMGQEAYSAAKLSSVVGYPFAADNGVVMFYNTDMVSDVSEIDTIDELFALADLKDAEVNYTIGNGFYAAGALMTFAGGESLYELHPTETSYSSESHFNSPEGLKAAKMINSIANKDAIRNATTAPTKDVLATITDVSKVQSFKSQLGDKYAVAPMPYVDNAQTTRLGSYLGYKFYGVNNTLPSTDKTHAAAVAKFLCSEYAQAKRFDSFNVRPTLSCLDDYASKEPHIAALSEQTRCKSTIPLTAIASELWSATASAITQIRDLSADDPDSKYQAILAELDSLLRK